MVATSAAHSIFFTVSAERASQAHPQTVVNDNKRTARVLSRGRIIVAPPYWSPPDAHLEANSAFSSESRNGGACRDRLLPQKDSTSRPGKARRRRPATGH